MKSNICALTGVEGQLETVLAEVEKCTKYNGLDEKSALRVRLLAEELVGMLPELLKNAEGRFWIENDGLKYELHVSVRARKTGYYTKEKLMSISTSGKNAARTGIMGKIRAAAEMMLFADDDAANLAGFYGMGMASMDSFNRAWSLSLYMDRVNAESQEEAELDAWDELEKSIIARLADNVVVGINGKQVDIIVHKDFK